MTLNCNGTLVDLSKPKVMGVLNLTPDSFFDGGHYNQLDAAVNQCEKMLQEGADFIDLGAYSSRPGADDVTEQEELKPPYPRTGSVLKQFPEALFSIDTFRARVAQEALTVART